LSGIKIAAGRPAAKARTSPDRTERDERCSTIERNVTMIWTIVVILLLLWLLGMITSYTVGGLVHILLVVALIVVLVRLIQGRRLAT
jgi:predicted nucleic acid-binding Zn ribbon protein